MRTFTARLGFGKFASMKREDIIIRSRTVRYRGAVEIAALRFDAPRFSGPSMSDVEREIVLRQDAAAALVHDTARDIIILCEQFRAPVYEAGGAWLIELPAGKIDGDETAEACIRRELEEEVGYRAERVESYRRLFHRAWIFHGTRASLLRAGAIGRLDRFHRAWRGHWRRCPAGRARSENLS